MAGERQALASTMGPDKGKSKISLAQGGGLQAGPKEWPPRHLEAGVGSLCPWSPPCLSACSLEMAWSPGTNEATLHPGIWEHKRGLGWGFGLGQCVFGGGGQLLIRSRRGGGHETRSPHGICGGGRAPR